MSAMTKWKFIEANRFFFLSHSLLSFSSNVVDNSEQHCVHSTPTSFAPNVHVNSNGSHATGNNLNINLPDNNAVLRLEVELRDKNVRRRPNQHRAKGYLTDQNRPVAGAGSAAAIASRTPAPLSHHSVAYTDNYFVPMEKVSESFYSVFLSRCARMHVCTYGCVCAYKYHRGIVEHTLCGWCLFSVSVSLGRSHFILVFYLFYLIFILFVLLYGSVY